MVRGQAGLGEILPFRFGTESRGAGSDEEQPRQRPLGPGGHSCSCRAGLVCLAAHVRVCPHGGGRALLQTKE